MPGLEDLYREIILDHYRSPRNRGELDAPPAIKVDGHNPLCGDEITVFVSLDGDRVRDVAFQGAGCAISTKMVVDLGRIYRQDIDLNAAITLVGQLGKNLISILGVSAATPIVAPVVASLLKTVPGVGTLAGQLLQGIVQALITRWIGAVFIVYFKSEMKQPEGGLAKLARSEWEKLTTMDELRKLVRSARTHLSSGDDEN